MKKLLILIIIILNTTIITATTRIYTDEEICQAIYQIEGGQNTKYHYGIKSVKCEGKERCKKVCLNTVKNNRIRYAQYGHEKYGIFLEFLASRYCPNGEYLCENWLSNLKYYLKKGK